MVKFVSCFYATNFVFVAFSITYADVKFRFSTIYGDHMVLQKAPKRAIVWGYGEIGERVVLRLSKKSYYTHVAARQEGNKEVGVWQVVLQPMMAGGPYRITAYSHVEKSLKNITLDDVLFGDIWMCSGQSNMQFTLDDSDHGDKAINESINYPNIRVFTSGLDCSMTPRRELNSIVLPWSVPSAETLNGASDGILWSYFSAVCWYYGVQLYKTLNYPIGLISVSYVGSAIESWSSPDALTQCGWTGNALPSAPIFSDSPRKSHDLRGLRSDSQRTFVDMV